MLCRTLHVVHPDKLNELLTPRQLCEWWVAYQCEPWGELRTDYRECASLMASAGSSEVRMTWPYMDPVMMPDEVREEIERLERLHGNRSKNPDSA